MVLTMHVRRKLEANMETQGQKFTVKYFPSNVGPLSICQGFGAHITMKTLTPICRVIYLSTRMTFLSTVRKMKTPSHRQSNRKFQEYNIISRNPPLTIIQYIKCGGYTCKVLVK